METDNRATLSNYIINDDEVHLHVYFPPVWCNGHQVEPPQFDGDIVINPDELSEG